MKRIILAMTIISFVFANYAYVYSVPFPQDRNYFWTKDIQNIRDTLIKKHPNLFLKEQKKLLWLISKTLSTMLPN